MMISVAFPLKMSLFTDRGSVWNSLLDLFKLMLVSSIRFVPRGTLLRFRVFTMHRTRYAIYRRKTTRALT